MCYENTCVSCGDIIPEGRQVCPACLLKTGECPCKNCVPPKRSPGCHGKCPEYIEWHNDRIQDASARRKIKNQESMADEHTIKVTNRNKRRKPYTTAYKR